ncbi:DUF4253 domain-containing protein [Streptomyces sp. NPDC006527]|uniref:DUF4253 domain-containing protein n=1 Tax=Streptomyces sp. NPDC006527 TaxID=3364749 RepID=UPI003695FD24
MNYDNDTATFSAVVRDWKDGFGARIVGGGFATLHLSVAAPSSRLEGALIIAAEHFAFCPDNIWQGAHPNLATYAEHLIDLNRWEARIGISGSRQPQPQPLEPCTETTLVAHRHPFFADGQRSGGLQLSDA